ncbi:MAG: tRNA threonylcarbamoyladenosine dehydratase [Marinilabiliales bacterium]
MNNWQERTALLIGEKKIQLLSSKHVLIAGLGGVGGYAAEQICRAGIGKLTIIDGDKINISNKNRQLIALDSTIGINKAIAFKKRLLDINPQLELNVIEEYIKDERITEILDNKYDYVVDAIDTLSPKVFFIYNSVKFGHNIVSSMGAGSKTDPEKVKIADISKSYNCTLARILRKKLHRLGVYEGVKVVFSSEKSQKESVVLQDNEPNKKSTVGTISYMPAIFGCYCASVVIRDLISDSE